jgi:hypothetical protein
LDPKKIGAKMVVGHNTGLQGLAPARDYPLVSRWIGRVVMRHVAIIAAERIRLPRQNRWFARFLDSFGEPLYLDCPSPKSGLRPSSHPGSFRPLREQWPKKPIMH